MLHKTVNNRVLLSIKDGISGGRKTQYGILIDDDKDGYGSSISEYNLDFYDMAAGCHLAVFPSYYEPWGYTPLESAALGVPTITTDLAGFGRFIQQKTKNEGKGIFIIGRDGKTKQESLLELYDVMKKFTLMEHPERVDNKVRAKELSHLADWRVLVKNYIEAHNFAVLKK